jgi:uncharacterized membrane protein YhaH (DUF805 family)
MPFSDAISSVFSKYATFDGRAQRSEFWWFVLFNILVQIGLGFADRGLFGHSMYGMGARGAFGMAEGPSMLGGLYSLAVVIPSLAVGCRRLHDTDRSGWWQLIWAVPVIGAIVLLVFMTEKGTAGPNRFGDNPIDGDAPEFRHSPIPPVPGGQT